MRKTLIKYGLFVAALLFSLPINASTWSLDCIRCLKWRPLISVLYGDAIAKVDATNRFRIGESTYNYRANGNWYTQQLFGAALGAEARLNPCWSFQAALVYSQPRGLTGKGIVTQGLDAETAEQFSYAYQVISHQLLLEGKLLADLYQFFHPYAAIGLGFANNRAYNYNVTIVPAFITMSPEYSNHTKTSFSYSLGVGLELDLEPCQHLRGGLGYRFTDLGQTSLGSGPLNQTLVTNTLSQSNLYAHEFFVQLTYLV